MTIWSVNSTTEKLLTLMENLGYSIIGEIVWMKLTNDGLKIKTSNGYYLKHAQETCFLFGKRVEASMSLDLTILK